MKQGKPGRRGSGAKIFRPIRRLLPIVILALGLLPGCGADTTPTATPTATTVPALTNTAAPPTPTPLAAFAAAPAYWPTQGWRTSTPEEQGIDSSQLLAMLQHIRDAAINVRSVTVIRNGYIVLEAYQQPWTADLLYGVQSVTKSVTGALIGSAIAEGRIKDVNQPVLSFFPDLAVADAAAKEDITIEDLLTMRPGLDCADSKIGPTINDRQDWVQYILDLPMAVAPGKSFAYCTGGPHILSAILTQATGMSAADYAQQRLFGPLGIAASDLSWPSDPDGINIGGYGIAMKPRDMAKFGLLYLNSGNWDGKQLLPRSWVDASTRAQAQVEGDKNYGYLFWVYPDHFAAEGLGQQVIQIVKDRNMVVVFTSALDFNKTTEPLPLLRDYIIPAASANAPLPPNPTAQAALQAQVRYMANPAQPVPALPAIASEVTGKTYVMDDNQSGWQTLRFDFSAGQPEARVTLAVTGASGVETQTVAIGLDNVYRLSKTPDGAFQGWRGQWTADHTFTVRQVQSFDQLEESGVRLEFVGAEVNITVQELVFGHFSFSMHGVAK